MNRKEKETMSNAPTQEIRLGLIRAAIWENMTDHGIRYSIVFTKLYKSAEQWHDTGSFGRDDLPLIGKVSKLAYAWICQQKQKLPLPIPTE
jgi:hypothetical protein